VDTEQSTLGQVAGVRIASAARSDGRPELAEQITQAAWNAYGSGDDTEPLAASLIESMLANGNIDGAVHFVQQVLPNDSDFFRKRDHDADGQLTSTEVLEFWNPRRRSLLDEDFDGLITQEETGEAIWSFLSDADQDEDGSIDHREWFRSLLSAIFARFDVNRDGQLSRDEWSSGLFGPLDMDGDGNVTKEEFLDRPALGPQGPDFSPRASALTPEEKFAQNDVDGDGQVSIDEADDQFWESIAEFDRDGDGVVDLAEHEQGLQQRAMERATQFFDMMDTNSDGQASEEEGRCRSWAEWIRYDANRDNMLSKEEFLESQKRHDDQEDE
jgi:Ca2+-binding EF-hand superfamily protein